MADRDLTTKGPPIRLPFLCNTSTLELPPSSQATHHPVLGTAGMAPLLVRVEGGCSHLDHVAVRQAREGTGIAQSKSLRGPRQVDRM